MKSIIFIGGHQSPVFFLKDCDNKGYLKLNLVSRLRLIHKRVKNFPLRPNAMDGTKKYAKAIARIFLKLIY